MTSKTYVSNGTGVLYDVNSGEPLATVGYRIYRNPATGEAEELWWGGFALNQAVPEREEYVMELEDGRRGRCHVTLRLMDRLTEDLVFYHYDIKGIHALGRE
jgi:hypothetical protein